MSRWIAFLWCSCEGMMIVRKRIFTHKGSNLLGPSTRNAWPDESAKSSCRRLGLKKQGKMPTHENEHAKRPRLMPTHERCQ